MVDDEVVAAVMPLFEQHGARPGADEGTFVATAECLVGAALALIDSAGRSTVEAAVGIVREEMDRDRIIDRIEALLTPIDANAPPRPASAAEEVLALRGAVKELESRLEAARGALE